jgi:uncharacterized protein (DUF362 family)/NAD-dependent dihydropyrimidine dehydrogenase PreA subunit
MAAGSTVIVTACPDYDQQRVFVALRESLDLLGFTLPTDAPVGTENAPVLLKPNMLIGVSPEKGVTTHPSIFSAAARFFKEKGLTVVFGDSPSGMSKPLPTAVKCGLHAEAEALGIAQADFETGEDVAFPSGIQNRRFHVARGVLSSGLLVNLPKLKTHALTTMTGALKNIFGVIPGMRKSEFHIRHPDVDEFSRMLADLNGLVRSHLVIMDAVHAMEGNGPSGGSIVELGLLIVSRDPVAVDAVACRMMGLDPMTIPHVRMAGEAGVGNADLKNIEIRGTGSDRGPRKTFALPFRGAGRNVPRFLFRFARNMSVSRPEIDPEKCTRCGQCVKACPVGSAALSFPAARRLPGRDGGLEVPRHQYNTCIRCYCCQEVCPQGAIFLKTPFFGKIFQR